MINIGLCGDDCNYCPRYLVTTSGNEERLKEVARMWQIVGWRDTAESPEKLTCYGCASLEICKLSIKECAMEKGIESCGKCDEYPCEKLLEIFRNNEKEAVICQEQLSEIDCELFQRAFFLKRKDWIKLIKNIYP